MKTPTRDTIRLLMLLFLLTVLSGCLKTQEPLPTQAGWHQIALRTYRMLDEETGVACYIYGGRMSCTATNYEIQPEVMDDGK